MGLSGFSKISLIGHTAFYNQHDYIKTTKDELKSELPPKTFAYQYTIESRVWRVVKLVFSILIFPVGICRLLHRIVGRAFIVRASRPSKGSSAKTSAQEACSLRKNVNLTNEWKIKRLAIKVDDYVIDAAIIGKPSTLGNGKWVLASNGSGEYAENNYNRSGHSFRQILSEVNGNGVVFNYPGVGGSSGMPSRSGMTKAYRAMLSFLEDQEKGIGAKQIIGWGFSIGAGTQGEALNSHKLKEGIDYMFVSRQTFGSLSSVITGLSSKPLGMLSKCLGWNMSPVNGSKKLKVPEIVIQTADVNEYTDISKKPELVIDDDIIKKEASYTRALLKGNNGEYTQKYFIGVPEKHNEQLANIPYITKIINQNFLIRSV